MKLINLNSKSGVINLFADYILKHINPDLNTVIQVTDVDYFFLINGITESKEILNLNEIKDSFISEYQGLLESVGYSTKINLMDLLKYNPKFNETDDRELFFTYYDSQRPVYHENVLNSNLDGVQSIIYDKTLKYEFLLSEKTKPDIKNFTYSDVQISSSFPHGYSLNMGRGLMYYGEYISKHVFDAAMTNEISLYLTNMKSEDDEPVFEVYYQSPVSQLKVKSMILDNFDFNFEKFKKMLSTYDLCDDIKKPTEEKPWLVNDVHPNDLVII